MINFEDGTYLTDDGVASQQIENDKLTLLYAIGCESDTAGDNMLTLCSMADVDYGKLLDYAPEPF
jgi:hypothetical protein